ncbi:MAG TPA: hypothetical protein VGG39_23095 [Polyangiaceae bacterium]
MRRGRRKRRGLAILAVIGATVPGAAGRAQTAAPDPPSSAPAPVPTVLAPFLPAAPPAALDSAERDLSSAEKAYVDLDFDRANQLVDSVVQRGHLTHAQLVRAFGLLGRTHAILNHDEAARAAFVKLLTYSPDEREDRNLPPRVTMRMAEARGILDGYPSRPGIEVAPSLVAGDGGALHVTTHDPTHVVQRVVVGWRWGVTGEFSTSSPVVGDEVEVPLATAPTGAARLDYYADAVDDRGDVVFEVGNADAPKTALVPVPPSTPPAPTPAPPTSARPSPAPGRSILASPVFWAIAGGVLVGVGTSAYFGLRTSHDDSGPASSARLTPVLLCGADRCQ